MLFRSKRETFAMRFYQSASYVDKVTYSDKIPASPADGIQNLYRTSTSGSSIYTDIGSSDSRFFEVGGQYGYLVDASSTTNALGLMFYDSGIAVLDIEKITSSSQFVSGNISAMNFSGYTTLGGVGTETENVAKVVPDLLTSASIDDILDHFCYARFGSGSLTAMTFQNVTNINSSLIFCRALPDDFNYSSNPTYIEKTGDYAGRMTIYDPSVPEENQEIGRAHV